MINGNKGQTLFLSVIVAAMIFVAGVIVVNFIKDDVSTSRIDMDCANPAISDGAKLTCLGIDIVVPYFIVIFLSAAGGLITAKLLI